MFRQLDPDGKRPVCSEITAVVYDKALRYRFGVAPQFADPDHIHDWVLAHPDEWELVFRVDDVAESTGVDAG